MQTKAKRLLQQRRDEVRKVELRPDPAGGDAMNAKLSDVAYARIFSRIAAGDYTVNAKLPTENELAEQLAVSRPIIREALARLRDDGLVISRRGSGTYVRRAPLATDQRLAPLSSIADMRKCLEFRMSFEGETAFFAAQAGSAGDRSALIAAVERLKEGMKQGELSIEDDFAFHYAIAQATNNRFFQATMAAMREPIAAGMQITRNFELLRTRERLIALHQEHLDIYAAIRENDAPAARAAMQRHLGNAMKRAFEGVLS